MTIEQELQAAFRLLQLGQLAQAEERYRAVLARQPNQADALNLLGMILGRTGRLEESIEMIGRAVAAVPSAADYRLNFGMALQCAGRLAEAIASYRQAIAINPSYADAYFNLGVALYTSGQRDPAAAAYRDTLRLNRNHPGAWGNLGQCLRETGQFDHALHCLQKAVRLAPSAPEGYVNLGNLLHDMGRPADALAACRKAVELQPDIAINHGNLLLMLNYQPEITQETIYSESLTWAAKHAEPLRRFIPPHRNDRSPDRKLKIGFVSPDFRHHPVGRILLPVLEALDREQLEIHCYSLSSSSDSITQRIRAASQGWVDAKGLDDSRLAQRIAADGIDILVDLAGHTAQNGLLVFAHKPAPVQVAWIGYLNTTGMSAMDYRLTDGISHPPGSDAFYTEKLIRLPRTSWCFQPDEADVPPKRGPAEEQGLITFGSFNNFAKVSVPIQQLWGRILLAVPRSRLLVHAPSETSLGPMRDRLASDGIASDRVGHLPRQKFGSYLQSFHRADIALDSFPFSGGMTTCDCLWMGLPVVSLAGLTLPSRSGCAILNNLGRPQWIAQTEEEYLGIAVKLASDADELARIRISLRQEMRNSPLMDARQLARDIEAAFRQIWQAYLKE